MKNIYSLVRCGSFDTFLNRKCPICTPKSKVEFPLEMRFLRLLEVTGRKKLLAEDISKINCKENN